MVSINFKANICFSELLKHKTQDNPRVKPSIDTHLNWADMTLDVTMS